MSRSTFRSALSGPLVAIGVGLVIGAFVVSFAAREARFAGSETAQLAININGVDQQMSRDVLLPQSGWVLEIELPPDLTSEIRATLQVTLRAERTGATIEIADQLSQRDDLATLVIPESLGLFEGLLSIRATLVDAEGTEIEAYRRVRIRRWLGGPPIGSREVIHFDFAVDRDTDGRPDFERDLAQFGLGSARRPELAAVVAGRLARRALARVERAYDRADDPNRTGFPRDQVFVRFMLEAEPGPFVTRICVGGANLAHPDSIGNVQFDHRNARKASNECDPKRTGGDGAADRVAAGVFPAEFTIYQESPLYRDVFGPFLTSEGGTPIGDGPHDVAALSSASPSSAPADPADSDSGSPATGVALRRAAIDRAIAVLGDALGTIMAHETAHALGLVPEGKPGVGLFGGGEDLGDGYAHNLEADGKPTVEPWLMNTGRDFRFEDLAGLGPSGELLFRPLNFAYLKDRVVLVDDRRP